jgi:protein disulfide-isomerase
LNRRFIARLALFRLCALILAFTAALAGCRPSGEAVTTASSDEQGAASSVAQVEGIEWFDGDVDAAFASAGQQGRLVFLYWGAQWCPPCYDLKAHVFPRPDFQQALRQFVPVYLDGDAPGAQRIADQFGVLGYPSVVVLKPDRTELARISGGSDLASYADVLDLALDSAQPVDELLAALGGEAAVRLAATDCRRLAWNDWSAGSADPPTLAAALQLAATRCPVESRVERDRLMVTAADLLASSERAAIEQGAAPSARLSGLMAELAALLADPQRSLDAGNALLYLDADYFAVVRRAQPQRAAALGEHYFALLDALERDARQSDTVRLLSAARRLQAAKALAGAERAPEAVASRARATLDAFLARDYDANARAGIVNSASWVLYELGDDARLRSLLEEQMKVARTPYYYMPDIADIEERAGNTRTALDWLERGYRESKGPATRFQWGTLYVNGLLRMTPHDVPRIRSAVIAVTGELDGPDRIHARARARLTRLDAALGEWATTTGNGATLEAIGQHWRQLCARLPAIDAARETCQDLLG